ncbi:hypothetical protein HK100_002642 [Physocladia obscura]|uniref:N-acetyltransferase domain-containing protein n=1 Tax=Physocladia obscura TaxID=109957 RepID=A0AAD5SV35_9FUNG|nr:hypothetical protein HK100_002642 [Physocladia obscura]
MHVKQASKKHAAVLSTLAGTTFVENFGYLIPPGELDGLLSEQYSEAAMAQQLETEIVFFLCNDDDTDGKAPIGFCQLKPDSHSEWFGELEYEKPCWEIHRFYFLQEQHGKGVAKILMDFVLEYLHSEKEVKTVWLFVWSENYKAQAFYKKHGIQDNFKTGMASSSSTTTSVSAAAATTKTTTTTSSAAAASSSSTTTSAAVTTTTTAAATTASTVASGNNVWSTDSSTGFSFSLLGPQSHVGAGGEWYLRTANSIIDGVSLLPSLATIQQIAPGALDGNPNTAGSYTGTSGTSSSGVPTLSNSTAAISSTSSQPAWKRPVEIAGGIVGGIAVLALLSFCYSKYSRSKEEEFERKEQLEAAVNAPSPTATAPTTPTPLNSIKKGSKNNVYDQPSRPPPKQNEPSVLSYGSTQPPSVYSASTAVAAYPPQQPYAPQYAPQQGYAYPPQQQQSYAQQAAYPAQQGYVPAYGQAAYVQQQQQQPPVYTNQPQQSAYAQAQQRQNRATPTRGTPTRGGY